ncbi:MAG: S24/S26 family peptidase [Pseudomonadota bacterium]
MIRLLRVRGRSMLPTLQDGDLILVRRISTRAAAGLAPGTIVCVRHPHFGFMIKRLRAHAEDGTILLDSDGQTGADHTDLGPVAVTAVTHRFWFRLSGRRRHDV